MNRLIIKSVNHSEKKPCILVFTEGTIIGPKCLLDFFNFRNYEPINGCVVKLKNWETQGARIEYLTSRRGSQSASVIMDLLVRYEFPGTALHFRTDKDTYKDIVEYFRPDILIEDDCRSIGGRWQMSIRKVDEKIKAGIKSITVKEFKGIDHLPDSLIDLINY